MVTDDKSIEQKNQRDEKRRQQQKLILQTEGKTYRRSTCIIWFGWERNAFVRFCFFFFAFVFVACFSHSQYNCLFPYKHWSRQRHQYTTPYAVNINFRWFPLQTMSFVKILLWFDLWCSQQLNCHVFLFVVFVMLWQPVFST